MKKKLLFLLLGLCAIFSNAQEDAWVFLIDKPNVEEAINNPISILTQRSLDRKLAQGIAIDYQDVPVNETYISEIKSQAGITVLAKSKWFNSLHVRGSESEINNLLNLNFVDYIEFADRNLNTNSRLQRPQNKFRVEEGQVDFDYGSTANQVEMIAADKLHELNFTGEGILIAVMDSGFPNVNTMEAFKRARDNNDILGGYDFQRRTSDIYGYVANSHGTWVLSDMAGYIENEFVGTAPDASYVLYRTEVAEFENPVEESFWVEAAERADSLGVDLINTSLGYKDYDNSNYTYSDTDLDGQTAFITRGATVASNKGILVVTSAGNSGANGVGAPADSQEVFSIGAVDANENYVTFSSQGSTIQPSIKPDVVARGAASIVVNTDGTIVSLNGTSFSSPILAGGMACLMQALPNASIDELKEIVRQTASQSMNPDFMLGHGIPDLFSAYDQFLKVSEPSLKQFKYYPNPISDHLYIQLPEEDIHTNYQLFDILGKLVLDSQLSESENRIELSFLEPGMYLLKLKGTINQTIKLIKS